MRPPKHLSKEVKAVWRELERQLVNPLETGDLLAFEMLCQATADHREASAILTRDGAVVEHGDGRISLNPYGRVKQQAASVIQEYSRRFGMSPVDRARLAKWTPPKKEQPGPNSILRFLTPPANITPFDPEQWDHDHPEDFDDEEEEIEDANER